MRLVKRQLFSRPEFSRFKKGYDRVSGFYGRFGRSAGARGVERKFFDTAISFTADSTGEVPATGQLTLIPQGVTESTRVGRKAFIHSINGHGKMTLSPGAAANGSASVFMYLILDKQANGAAAGVTDVFTGTGLSTALHNLVNSQRFIVLKKWNLAFNAGAGVTTAYNTTVKLWTLYKRFKSLPIEYSSTTGAITEIKSNNLFLMAGTGGLTDDLVSINGTIRLRFTD